MTVLTLDEIKAHLRLDGNAEDAQLTLLSSAAEDYAAHYLGRSLPWLDESGAAVAVPASIKAALLLIVGDLYENREGAVVGASRTDNPTVNRLMQFHRTGLGV